MDLEAALAIGIGFSMGLGFGWAAVRKHLLLARARHWPSVRGRILVSEVYRDEARGAQHFRIRYQYRMGDLAEGSTPRLSGDWFWSDRAQAAFVARFLPGSEVEVFYDPSDPRRTCIDRTDRSGVGAMAVLALMGTVLATTLVLMGKP